MQQYSIAPTQTSSGRDSRATQGSAHDQGEKLAHVSTGLSKLIDAKLSTTPLPRRWGYILHRLKYETFGESNTHRQRKRANPGTWCEVDVLTWSEKLPMDSDTLRSVLRQLARARIIWCTPRPGSRERFSVGWLPDLADWQLPHTTGWGGRRANAGRPRALNAISAPSPAYQDECSQGTDSVGTAASATPEAHDAENQLDSVENSSWLDRQINLNSLPSSDAACVLGALPPDQRSDLQTILQENRRSRSRARGHAHNQKEQYRKQHRTPSGEQPGIISDSATDMVPQLGLAEYLAHLGDTRALIGAGKILQTLVAAQVPSTVINDALALGHQQLMWRLLQDADAFVRGHRMPHVASCPAYFTTVMKTIARDGSVLGWDMHAVRADPRYAEAQLSLEAYAQTSGTFDADIQADPIAGVTARHAVAAMRVRAFNSAPWPVEGGTWEETSVDYDSTRQQLDLTGLMSEAADWSGNDANDAEDASAHSASTDVDAVTLELESHAGWDCAISRALSPADPVNATLPGTSRACTFGTGRLATIWSMAQERIQSQMTKAQFDTWLSGTELVPLIDDMVAVCPRTVFAVEQLEHRFGDRIRHALKEAEPRIQSVYICLYSSTAALRHELAEAWCTQHIISHEEDMSSLDARCVADTLASDATRMLVFSDGQDRLDGVNIAACPPKTAPPNEASPEAGEDGAVLPSAAHGRAGRGDGVRASSVDTIMGPAGAGSVSALPRANYTNAASEILAASAGSENAVPADSADSAEDVQQWHIACEHLCPHLPARGPLRSWLRQSRLVRTSQTCLVLLVPNAFTRERLMVSYATALVAAVTDSLGDLIADGWTLRVATDPAVQTLRSSSSLQRSSVRRRSAA